MLQRVYPKVAQNAAGQRTESGAAGLSCRCNYDMDSKRTGKAEKEIEIADSGSVEYYKFTRQINKFAGGKVEHINIYACSMTRKKI